MIFGVNTTHDISKLSQTSLAWPLVKLRITISNYIYLTQLTTRSVVSLACITSLCLVQCFPGGHSLHLSFGSFFYPHPSRFSLPLLNQCDRCPVPLAWGLMAGGRGFASRGAVTLSRGWLCQRWKPLDIRGTHLHQARHAQWLMPNMTTNHAITYTYTLSVSCLNLA